MILNATQKEIENFLLTASTISEDAKEYFKKKLLDGLDKKSKIIYISDKAKSDLLVAITNQEDYDNSYRLIDNQTVYLVYIPHHEKNINEQNFMDLLSYAEHDLKNKGFKNLTIGVDVSYVNDLKIILNFGFSEFVKYSFRPLKSQNNYKTNALVAYYKKIINL